MHATCSPESISAPVVNGKRMTYIEFLDNSPMTPFLWLLLIGVALAQILDGINFQSTAFALPLITQGVSGSIPTAAGLIGSMTNVGLFFGALIILSALRSLWPQRQFSSGCSSRMLSARS